jgi:UDP-N-acetylglucosamine 2-epimerase (non-hydrolysing)
VFVTVTQTQLTQSQTIAVVVGTRPEAIKMAPLVLALRREPRYRPVLVSTAQHTEMLDQALGAFGLRPDIDLGLMRPGDSLEGFLGNALEPLGRVFRDLKPTVSLVQGDTMSVLAAAQASFFRGVPVGHVEAGLRSKDMRHPFPEEATRRLVSIVTSYHFAPTPRARDNLVSEGVDPTRVWVTGNTCVDALRQLRLQTPACEQIRELDFEGSRVLLVTAHRRENHGKPLRDICAAIRDIVARFPDVQVVVPVHNNPAVKSVMREELGDAERVHLLPPLDYSDLVYIMRRCTLILTDSGGIQEEAPSCNCPVLILRGVTERPEVVEAGGGILVGTDRATIVAAATSLLNDRDAYDLMANAPNPFGDGYASERIVTIIGESFERRRLLSMRGAFETRDSVEGAEFGERRRMLRAG